MYAINTEKKADYWEVEALFDLCFAPGREALSSYRLRENSEPISELCMVARDKEQILAGAIRYWLVNIIEYEALLLGPIAVHPTRQGEGLGSLLIKDSLVLAKKLGYSRILLIGDFPYPVSTTIDILLILLTITTPPSSSFGIWSGILTALTDHILVK